MESNENYCFYKEMAKKLMLKFDNRDIKIFWIIFFFLFGVYERRKDVGGLEEAVR
jgi:hypothetical protein